MSSCRDKALEETDWLMDAIVADNRANESLAAFLDALANCRDWQSAAGELALAIDPLVEERAQKLFDERDDL